MHPSSESALVAVDNCSIVVLAHTGANDASSNELLDLASYARVTHMVIERSWIALGLLEDRLHNGICLLLVQILQGR